MRLSVSEVFWALRAIEHQMMYTNSLCSGYAELNSVRYALKQYAYEEGYDLEDFARREGLDA